LAAIAPARAEHVDASVLDDRGEPVRDAVVYAVPLEPASTSPPPEPIAIDQVDKEFVPHVTAVPVGARVDFPNRDQIRHHVYSFSEAKTFEIPLYKGIPAAPVEFDRPGEVVLGCNIHDWMKAYVFVAETPYFGITNDRGATAIELPAGDYQAYVWHPRLQGPRDATAIPLVVEAGERAKLRFSIDQRQVWNPRRAPSPRDPSYR
jgi:plastocyanin